jgi:iturin family lipopeptide synthetase A
MTNYHAGAIAIIGQSCRFPGATNPAAFAEVIYQQQHVITAAPATRWSTVDYPLAAWGGFIEGSDLFDAAFFGISAAEAKAMDPQQRILLELSWEAFAAAGHTREQLSGSNTAVFVGLATDDYSRIQHYDVNNLDVYLSTAHAKSIAANRLSYFFNLQGPSLAIDTACSSSLVAVHQACLSLRSQETDLALAAGVNLLFNPAIFTNLAEAGMLARDGVCKVFDATANGYVRGEGAGVVILKRYADAVRDNDPILAVILGSACNQDGASNGITAPNGLAQEQVITAALQQAGLTSAALQYVEAHGTGTPLGDPIEIAALATVLGKEAGRVFPCAVGSVKTNMGHLEAAAGIAGLIKTVLALQKQVIPPSLHLQTLNPAITDREKSVLYFPTAPTRLPEDMTFQYAGVSSFGFGGTNAHVILGAANTASELAVDISPPGAELFVFSAHNEQALMAYGSEYQLHWQKTAISSVQLSAYLFNKQSHLDHRCAIVAETPVLAAEQLKAWLQQQETAYLQVGTRQFDQQIVWVFSGQGGQYAGMGRELFRDNAIFRAAVMECDAIIQTLAQWSISELLQEENDLDRLNAAVYAQPLQVVVQIALARLWQHWGIHPAAIVGHSLGELPAAFFAGALTLQDTLRLCLIRGEVMLPGYHIHDGMLSCRTSVDVLLPLLARYQDKVVIAVMNSSTHLVLSGDNESLAAISRDCETQQIECQWLEVEAAFHSAKMLSAAKMMLAKADGIIATATQLPLFSTLQGKLITGDQLTPAYWAKQITSPVLFSTAMEQLIQQGYRQFLEISPQPILRSAMRECLQSAGLSGLVMGSLRRNYPELKQMLSTLGMLYVRGLPIHYNATPALVSKFIELPSYPWQQQRYWFDSEEMSLQPRKVTPQPTARALTKDDFLQEILQQMAALLGESVVNINPEQAFVEMGTDSIVIAKAIAMIEKRYGVPLSLRQFFEELSTPVALAHYLVMHATGKQISVVGKASLTVTSTVIPGPYRALKPSLTIEYSAAQTVYLQRFVEQYIAKTPTSKHQAAQWRNVLADSRAVAGFRPSTKELLYPLLGKHSEGSRLWDMDDNEYIDISMDFGVNLFGHQAPFIQQALQQRLTHGMALAPRAALMGETAELLCDITGMERAVFCTTGTEAVMTAIRLARLATRRNKIVMFEYSYHGHGDNVLAGRQADSFDSQPVVAGIPLSAVADTLVLSYDDPEALQIIERYADQIAAVLVEPIQARRPYLQPRMFLQKLRTLTAEQNIVLIFDEMITGFRLCPGGAQQWFDVKADLATYGKIIGGGCPLSAIAGSTALLAGIDGGLWQYGDQSYPAEPTTFFAGTFNGNALGMAAAHAVLSAIKEYGPTLQKELNKKTAYLATTLNHWLAEQLLPIQIVYSGSLFRFEFKHNLDILFYHLLAQGLFIWEGRNCFLSMAHTDNDIEKIIEKIKYSITELKQAGFITESVLPLTLAQKQLWALAQLTPEASMAYQESSLLTITGILDIHLLEMAWHEVIQRHDALRTTISSQGRSLHIAKQAEFSLYQLDVSHEADSNAWSALTALLQQPFDLVHGPLLRVGVAKVTETSFYLLTVVHHIIADGWSLGIIINDVVMLYKALLQGEALPTKPVLQISDYNQWLHQQLPAMQSQQHYWQQELADLPPALFTLPIDEQQWLGSQKIMRLSAEETQSIRHFAKETNHSLFMVLLAFYQSYLHKLFDRQDLIVGSPTLGRSMPKGGEVVAYCTHLLPLRSSYQLDDTFASFLARSKTTVLNAFDHQDYPYAHILSDLPSQTQHNLIQVIFNIDKVDMPTAVDEWAVCLQTAPLTTANFPLSLHVLDANQELELAFKYQQSFFSENEMHNVATQFCTWIQQLLVEPKASLAAVSLLPPTSWQQISQWNDNAIPYPLLTIDALFMQQVSLQPQAIALESTENSLTYEELNIQVDALAIELMAKKQAIIAVALQKRADIIIAMLAILRSGSAFLMLDEKLPDKRLQAIVTSSQCQLVIANKSSQPRFQPWVNDVLLIEEVNTTLQMVTVSYPVISPTALAYIVFTSGSTGDPKGVMIEQKSVVNFAHWLQGRVNLVSGLRVDCSSNLAFDFALATSLVTLLTGATVVTCEDDIKHDIEAYWDYLDKQQLNLVKLTPSYFRLLLLEAKRRNQSPTFLKTIILAGEPINSTDCQAWFSLSPQQKIINCYGPTETTISVLMHDVSPGEEYIPLGKPEHNIRAYIVTTHLQLADINVVGELCLAGDCVGQGYLDATELTAQRFIHIQLPDGRTERLYRTGDQAKYRENGDIEYKGRIDEQVKIRGYRVELNEITTLLRQHPAIKDVATSLHEQKIIVYYVSEASTPLEAELRLFLAGWLPEYMLPTWYVQLDSIPLNRNYKLDKTALPLPIITHAVNKQMTSHIQEALLGAWEAVLNVAGIGLQDNFFSLGGDSITAILLVARMRGLGFKLSANSIYQFPTIAKLAKEIEHETEFASQAPLQGEVLLSPIQQRFFDLGLASPEHYNQAVVFTLLKPLQKTRFQAAVDYIINYHDSLRLQFTSLNNTYQQSYAPTSDQTTIVVEEHFINQQQAEDFYYYLQSQLDITRGPLIKIAIINDTEQANRAYLFIAIHHLLTDFISWQVMLGDLFQAYMQLQQQQPIKLMPKTHSYQQWSIDYAAYALLCEHQVDYWCERLQPRHPRLSRAVRDTNIQQRVLAADLTTSLLTQMPLIYDVHINTLFLAALLLSFTPSSSLPLRVMLEGHGREEIISSQDYSRTIGWFTSVFPIKLELPSGDNHFKAVMQHLQAELANIPDKGVGYGALRYLYKHVKLQTLNEPDICFNYLGQSSLPDVCAEYITDGKEPSGTIALHNKANYTLEINAVVNAGQLFVYFKAIHTHYYDIEISQLADRYMQLLTDFIQYGQTTLSSQLSSQELNYITQWATTDNVIEIF